eukprot:3424787-Pyramimonas_sp.AAC.1
MPGALKPAHGPDAPDARARGHNQPASDNYLKRKSWRLDPIRGLGGGQGPKGPRVQSGSSSHRGPPRA